VVKEGTWLATFTGPGGSGGSVLMLKAGRISGKTDAYRYAGTYKVIQDVFCASISVREVVRMSDSFAGIEGSFELEIVGFFEEAGALIEATGFIGGDRDKSLEIVLSHVREDATRVGIRW
jgi:hypothetical protein